MTTRADTNPIAVRNLQIRTEDGTVRELLIEIYAPICNQTGMPWHCRYRINGLWQRPVESESVGEDAMQCLHLCIQAVAGVMEAALAKGMISYPDGEKFDNLELCKETIASRRPQKIRSALRTDRSLAREIRKATLMISKDPVAAQRMLRTLRRRASAQGLVPQMLVCLDGELASAREAHDDAEELRLLRAIASCQPSAPNLAALGGALLRRGEGRAARTWFLRAAAVVEPGTKLERMIVSKLNRLP
ncbi:DUF6968 family protein [Chondromyces apiculatus]|uniref:DUF6968 family protein n=1 Tax=Chondromyces apiculatus TaxID=51 RepID=UPI0012DCE20F|nr:hypothetical protein [Chondromyces apiculatus]